MFFAGVESRIGNAPYKYNSLNNSNIKIIKSFDPKKEVAQGLLSIENLKDIRIIRLNHGIQASTVYNWKNKFVEAFEQHFSDNGYYMETLGKRPVRKEIHDENSWHNILGRIDEQRECCGIMIGDVLKQFYQLLDSYEGIQNVY